MHSVDRNSTLTSNNRDDDNEDSNNNNTFIPSYLWGGSLITPSAEATKPGPLRNPTITALVSTYLSFWQTSVK